jgi:ectoine hydroxylase
MNVNPLTSLLNDEQKRHYAETGYLQLDSFVGPDWMARLKSAAAEFVELARTMDQSDKLLDLAPGHSGETPRIRRLNSPADNHETFREFAIDGPAAGLACDLLGGPVRYHHGKLNYKWSDGGEEIKWHQDIQFWPHTDFTPLTIGVYLDDVDDEMGPMGVLPCSHTGPLYDLYAEDGSWAGAMRDEDIATLELERMVWLKGPAGSVTVHNCCMVHGSVPNNSQRPRPLLLQTYSAESSFPLGNIGANSVRSGLAGRIIGGAAEMSVTVDGRTMRGAPDWSQKGGVSPTIFGSQLDRN